MQKEQKQAILKQLRWYLYIGDLYELVCNSLCYNHNCHDDCSWLLLN